MNLLLYVVSIYVVKSKRRILFATFFIYAAMMAGSLLMLSSHKLFSEDRSVCGVGVESAIMQNIGLPGHNFAAYHSFVAIGFAH